MRSGEFAGDRIPNWGKRSRVTIVSGIRGGGKGEKWGDRWEGEHQRGLGRRLKPQISRGERKNRDQRGGRERENRGCGGEWR